MTTELELRLVQALESIAMDLSGLLEATNPVNPVTTQLLEEDNKVRAFYSNESDDIVSEHLRRMGKEPKA